ncbi:pyridoxamine 5'-phosphate oxidase family protein [Thiolapillus sp.]
MARRYPALEDAHREFIAAQQMFFVATAGREGAVNLSPKGLDSLRVLDASHLAWLNLTGSGNETAAHLRLDGRMTLMFCAFEGDPLILRLYGQARAVHQHDAEWEEWVTLFPSRTGARQVVLMDVQQVQTSCGFGVPLFAFKGQRQLLPRWAEKKGQAGLEQYWREKNAVSLDGLDTGTVDSHAEEGG